MLASDHHTQPKRKLDRSCEVCRKQKIKCDGAQQDTGICSHCAEFNIPCVYSAPVKRGPKKKASVTELLQRIAMLEAKLRAVSVSRLCAACSQPLVHAPARDLELEVSNPTQEGSSDSSGEIDDLEEDALTAQFACISLGSHYSFGAGFDYLLAAKAVAEKNSARKREAFEALNCQYAPSWDQEPTPDYYVYPDNDLMAALVGLYFENVHSTLPILHRDAFERALSAKLHLRDGKFGATLLAVLAVASQYSDDPRVLVDGYSAQSSGWMYMTQIQLGLCSYEINVYEVQTAFLLSLYALTTSKAHSSWIYLGVGIRFLQQRGARSVYQPCFEDCETVRDMWSRALWCFMCLDRILSVQFGRPVGLDLDAFQQQLVLPRMDFAIQPPQEAVNYQSYIAIYVRLCKIIGNAMDRVYGSQFRARREPKNCERHQEVVAELDSELNDWVNSLPTHLRWTSEYSATSHPQAAAYFDQAHILYVTQNYLRIVIHRPFIGLGDVIAAPSMSICTQAASCIIQATDAWLKTRQRLPSLLVVCPVFLAAVTLTFTMWGKQSDIPAKISWSDKGEKLVARAVEILESAEIRRAPDGVLRRMLIQLQSVARRTVSSDNIPHFQPGTSIEDLLAQTAPLDYDYLSLWMQSPQDFEGF
ncbi:Fungal-trans domain-containing protein [Mycena kentingensis (nom. inval.)]|nr:Fungal-trans domain-containing protein [Mycena kentingensis (nom. inval.)]